jgi:hypothetical protein
VTHTTWGIIAIALAAIAGLLAGIWIGYERGLRHAEEEAEWQREDARWKKPADTPAPPETPHAGPGKHRHPPGPRHAAPPPRTALPVAGHLPAADGPWNATLIMPAPVQQAPWYAPPPEPQTEVLEPTAVLPGPVPVTDTGWTREMAAQVADMDRFMARLIGATDATLKEITS